ncbi:uncharacterized protein LOC134684930 [Mytilus trossulus]|uniref:uncharacterized protein LOC134684930 n=1 Tax=Mytilus trossulus TaxID=6551 RepID=UPI0030062717
MAEASLSGDEENYVRMSLLLTGVCPRGVRATFDREFAPSSLGVTIKKEYNKLKDLQLKHRINRSQWKTLYPRYPGVPESINFDITLMITLLRNLTSMIPPNGGYDQLPTITDTTPGADLSRIKYYRNFLAHLDDGRIDTTFFNTAWTDITGAIERLGGQKMKRECDQLKSKPLDQTNQEIMIDIKHSNDEIRELQSTLEKLKFSQTEMRKSHELLQENYEEGKKSHALLQDKVTTSQQDTVPWNVRAQIKQILLKWKKQEKMFVITRAATHVLKSLQKNSCVTITASSGMGKTAILHYVALQMSTDGYDILLVTDPGDIVKFYNPNKKTVFVIDDFCGNFSLNQTDIKIWEPVIERIKEILEDKQTKIMVACRLQVYQDDKFNTLSIFKSCVCNLLSDNMCLLNTEKQSIAEVYLATKALLIRRYFDLYDCFPLLCQLYHKNPKLDMKDFFKNPFSVYEAQFDQLQQKGCYGKYCALALCVVFNNKLKEEILTEEIDDLTRNVIENTCEACKLERGTSRLIIKDELDSLLHSLLKKQDNIQIATDTHTTKYQSFYTAIHGKIFDFLAKYFGEKIIDCLIKNADSCLIRERFLLEKENDIDQFIIIVPSKYYQIYMRRIINEWSKGNLQDVFMNSNMKLHQFRQMLLCYIEKLDISYQTQLADTCDNDNITTVRSRSYQKGVVCDTVMLHCCLIGDISMIQWCCKLGVDVNQSGSHNQSPLIIACKYGHVKVVSILLEEGADYNKCDISGQSSVMIACRNNDAEIVRMLLDDGADYNKCDINGYSPMMTVCRLGHTIILRMMLDKGKDCNKCNDFGQSFVFIACKYGHTDMVRMLLNKGANYNKCDNNGQSPVMISCVPGRTEIVMMLIEKGADYNKSDMFGESPLILACRHCQIEIVRLLIEKGADYNKCDNYGHSPLMIACEDGHTHIVNMLLEKGANYNQCNSYGQSPVMMACKNGHTEIVIMLLNKGADLDKCDSDGQSPIFMACRYGHREIVCVLLDKDADYTKFDILGQYPITIANILGFREIVRVLLEKGHTDGHYVLGHTDGHYVLIPKILY